MSYKKVIKVFIPNSDKQISLLFYKISPSFTISSAKESINDSFSTVEDFENHLQVVNDLEQNVKHLLETGCILNEGDEIGYRGDVQLYKLDKVRHSIYPLYSTIVTTYYLHEII